MSHTNEDTCRERREEAITEMMGELLHGDSHGGIVLFDEALKDACKYKTGLDALVCIQKEAEKGDSDLAKALREYLEAWATVNCEV